MKILPALLLLLVTTVTHSQNVGISTNAPLEKLHIDSGNIKIGRTVLGSGQVNLLKFGDGNFVMIGESEADDQMSLTASYFLFRSNGGFGGRVGINVSSGVPAAQLEVIGGVKITDGTQGSGKIFVSDGVGLGSWKGAVGFSAHLFGNVAIPGGGVVNFICSAIDHDPGANYNSSTGQFTAPETGIYHFDISAVVSTGAAGQTIRARIFKNGVSIKESSMVSSAGGVSGNLSMVADIYLNVSDVVEVRIINASLGGITLLTDAGTLVSGTYFDGHLVR